MFKTTFHLEPAKTRCYHCGSDDIAAICHHCGRAMDEIHSEAIQSTLASGAAKEFSYLNLSGNSGFEGYAEHCDSCRHHDRKGKNFLFLGLILLTLGGGAAYYIHTILRLTSGWSIALVTGAIVLGIVLALAGVFRLVTTGPLRDIGAHPLPVVAENILVDIRETIEGKIFLSPERSYSSSLKQIHGQCLIQYICNPQTESRRFKKYKTKHKIADNGKILAHFGFVQLTGAGDVIPIGDDAFLKKAANTLQLTAPVNKLIFLKESNATRKQSTFVFDQRYGILNSEMNNNNNSLPVTILPHILGEETHRTLQLLIYVQLEGWINGASLESYRVDLFDINVPNELGRVVSTQPTGMIELRAKKKTTGILWKNPSLKMTRSEVSEDNNYSENWYDTNEKSSAPLILTFSLDRDIDVRSDTLLQGRLRLRLKGLYSGISGANLFSALGKKLSTSNEVSSRTYIDINFELSLAALLTQKVHILKKEIVENNISPDYQTVSSIIKLLNENDIVLGNVIESAPHTGRGGSNVLYRRWDLGGHFFEGLWPLKFNLTITGQQSEKLPGLQSTGNTRIEVTVRSNYHEEGMQQKIEDFYKSLVDYVIEAIVNLPRGPLREDPATQFRSPNEKLEQLEDALLSGRISEEVYKDIKDRILTG